MRGKWSKYTGQVWVSHTHRVFTQSSQGSTFLVSMCKKLTSLGSDSGQIRNQTSGSLLTWEKWMVREKKKVYLNLIKLFSREIASEHTEQHAKAQESACPGAFPLPAPFQTVFLLQSGAFPSKHAPMHGARRPLSQ